MNIYYDNHDNDNDDYNDDKYAVKDKQGVNVVIIIVVVVVAAVVCYC